MATQADSGSRTVAVAGAGFSGAVVARQLADAGHRVHVVDPRPHLAGNCHTERDPNGVMVHRYGPHIFHTASDRVWAYVRRFGEMVPYRHRVRAIAGGEEYSLPINLTTINQFFGVSLDPAGAEAFVAARAAPYRTRPQRSFRDRALATIGPELFEAFFAGYTAKQWGIDPAELPASVFNRLPVRFTANEEYFDHPYQAIPRHGYTPLVQAILDHPAITVELGRAFSPAERTAYDHLFWSAPLDEYFDRRFDSLVYRTIEFEFVSAQGCHQTVSVVNHCDRSTRITRVSEYRHFTPWEEHTATTYSRERPRARSEGDIPYYPVRLAATTQRLEQYLQLARAEVGVTFLGRLGTFRYLDMDNAIEEAMVAADAFIIATGSASAPPVFAVDVTR